MYLKIHLLFQSLLNNFLLRTQEAPIHQEDVSHVIFYLNFKFSKLHALCIKKKLKHSVKSVLGDLLTILIFILKIKKVLFIIFVDTEKLITLT